MVQTFDVIVVGGGAAGLFCAGIAGQRGRRVCVLEHNATLGRKILISGGGRCNFTNLYAQPENYLSENPRFCISALNQYPASSFIALVEQHGIAWYEKKLGQLFCRESAQPIIDMLVDECRAGQVDIRTSTRVQFIERSDGFILHTSNDVYQCTHLVIATGGLSISKLGASDFGYRIAKQFDIPCVAARPGLVPLRLSEEDYSWTALRGVSLPVSIDHQGHRFSENLLFSHRGISGPVVLQISSYWREGETLQIDLLPETDLASLLGQPDARNRHASTVLEEVWPRRFAQRWCEEHNLNRPTRQIQENELRNLEQKAHTWSLTVEDTEGYEKAEVTCGGIDTRALSPKTMESRTVPGLYFIGEVVDVTGWLGGYNFQWAWSSGFAAGQSV